MNGSGTVSLSASWQSAPPALSLCHLTHSYPSCDDMLLEGPIFSSFLKDSPSELKGRQRIRDAARVTPPPPSLSAISASATTGRTEPNVDASAAFRSKQHLPMNTPTAETLQAEAEGVQAPVRTSLANSLPADIIPVEQPVSLFTRYGRPGIFHARKQRTLDPAADHLDGHWRLKIKVPRPDPELTQAEVEFLLSGGFWLPSVPKNAAGLGHVGGSGPVHLLLQQQQQQQGDPTQSAHVPGVGPRLSRFMQEHMRVVQQEADDALSLLAWKSKRLARSMRYGLEQVTHGVSGAATWTCSTALSVLCCCWSTGPGTVGGDDEAVTQPLLGGSEPHDDGGMAHTARGSSAPATAAAPVPLTMNIIDEAEAEEELRRRVHARLTAEYESAADAVQLPASSRQPPSLHTIDSALDLGEAMVKQLATIEEMRQRAVKAGESMPQPPPPPPQLAFDHGRWQAMQQDS